MTFSDDVLAKLAQAKTLAEAITIARKAAGSHDRLGALLGTSRQTVIHWEDGRFPTRYRDKLIALGIPERLLVTVDKTVFEKRLRLVEAEVAAIRRQLR